MYVVFQTITNSNIYRHDLFAHGRFTNDLVCTNCSRPTLSADCQLVAYQSRGQVYLRDMQSGVAWQRWPGVLACDARPNQPTRMTSREVDPFHEQ